MRALYYEVFNPIHNGHIDIISRATKLFEEVIVLADEDEILLVRQAIKESITKPNVKVVAFNPNMTFIEFAKKYNIDVIIEEVRSNNCLDYKLQMAELYRKNGFETFFIPVKGVYSNLSSAVVRECIKTNLSISNYVPVGCLEMIYQEYKK